MFWLLPLDVADRVRHLDEMRGKPGLIVPALCRSPAGGPVGKSVTLSRLKRHATLHCAIDGDLEDATRRRRGWRPVVPFLHPCPKSSRPASRS